MLYENADRRLDDPRDSAGAEINLEWSATGSEDVCEALSDGY